MIQGEKANINLVKYNMTILIEVAYSLNRIIRDSVDILE